MKIICVEEHTMDAAIAKASYSAMADQASYMFDLGSGFQDEAGGHEDERPRLQSPHRAIELVNTPIAARLAAMDAGGIDMQVLSYSNMTQYAAID